MLFARLAETSAAVAATSSRIAKRAAIAAAVREVAAPPATPTEDGRPAELELVVTYLSGTLRQRRTGVGWASLGDLPAPAPAPELTVRDVDSAFERLAGVAGPGSAARRSGAVAELFARATEAEQRLLRGLVFDDVRQGALDSLVQDGVAEAFDVPATTLRRAAMLLGSTAAAAVVLATSGRAGLDAVSLRVGQPVRPMLAASAPVAGRRRRQDRPAGGRGHQARRHPRAGPP